MCAAGGLLLLGACSGGGSLDDAARDATSTTAPATTSTRSTLALDELDPSTLLVADGVSFGAPSPPFRAALDAFEGDPFVKAVDGAVAWDPVAVKRLGRVAVLGLDPAAFSDKDTLDLFVKEIASAVAETSEPTTSFRHENLLAVVSSPTVATANGLAAAMQTAVAAGQVGDATRVTPMKAINPASVFVELTTARFDAFKDAGEPTPTGTPTTEAPLPAPEPPVVPGVAGVAVAARQVVVANEVRAVAWGLAVPLAAASSAELLEPAIAALVAARAGTPTTSYVESRVVWSANPTDDRPAVRAFRHQNVIVFVQGADPIQLDALVAAWINNL